MNYSSANHLSNNFVDHGNMQESNTIRTSWITPHQFILQDLISVITSSPITPSKFWRFNKRNSQEIYTTLSCPYWEILHNLLHQNILRELIGVISSPRLP